MRLILPLTLALALTACDHAAATGSASAGVNAKARAIDGDTVAIDVRLFGADAFEKRQLCRTRDGCWPCGKAAQDLASRILKRGNAVIRLTGKQSYGRPIATVEVDGRDLGEEMIAAGLAIPVADFLASDPARAKRYAAAFDRAVSTRAGAQAGFYLDPAKWRHGARLSCEANSRGDEDAQTFRDR